MYLYVYILLFLVIFLLFIFLFILPPDFILNEKRKMIHSKCLFDVKLLDNFLSDEEIDVIISEGVNFEASYVTELYLPFVRNSKTCQLLKNTKSYQIIRNKLNKMGLSKYEVEDLQITKYGVGGFYHGHYDYFDEDDMVERRYLNMTGQRMKTIFAYLKPADKGGGTKFTKINKLFQLKKGQAIYWDNCYKVNDKYIYHVNSQHEAMPVLEGEKIGLNIWLSDKYMY